MIDRNHPAVEAAERAATRWMEDRELETDLDGTVYMLTAALSHLTADDLRHTPAGRALMAEAWRRGYRDRQNDYGAADVTPCPYKETTDDHA